MSDTNGATANGHSNASYVHPELGLMIRHTGVEVPFSALPEVSQLKLLTAGQNHYFGNELSAKLSQARKKAGEANTPWTDAEAAAVEDTFRADMWAALREGKVGHTTRAPRGTALETEINKRAIAKATSILNSQGIKMPAKSTDVVTLPDGKAWTRGDIIAFVMRPEGPHAAKIRKEAEDEMKRRDREAQAAVKRAAEQGLEGLAGVGL